MQDGSVKNERTFQVFYAKVLVPPCYIFVNYYFNFYTLKDNMVFSLWKFTFTK